MKATLETPTEATPVPRTGSRDGEQSRARYPETGAMPAGRQATQPPAGPPAPPVTPPGRTAAG